MNQSPPNSYDRIMQERQRINKHINVFKQLIASSIEDKDDRLVSYYSNLLDKSLDLLKVNNEMLKSIQFNSSQLNEIITYVRCVCNERKDFNADDKLIQILCINHKCSCIIVCSKSNLIDFIPSQYDTNTMYNIYNKKHISYLSQLHPNYSSPCIIHYPIYYDKALKLMQQYPNLKFKFPYLVYNIEGNVKTEIVPENVREIVNKESKFNKQMGFVRIYYPTTTVQFKDPKSIKSIAASAFQSFKKLETLDLRNTSVFNLPINLFQHCENLRIIRLPNNLLELNVEMFKNTPVTTVLCNCLTLEGSLDKTNIDTLSIPKVCLIKDWDAGSLIKMQTNPNHTLYSDRILYYPHDYNDFDQVETIGDYYMFDDGSLEVNGVDLSNQPTLTKLEIPSTVKKIQENSFCHSFDLKEVHIYNDLIIEPRCFCFNKPNLTLIVHGNHTLTIGAFCFENTRYDKVYRPD